VTDIWSPPHLPYRHRLAGYSLAARECWGRLANDLADVGAVWSVDEILAFLVVAPAVQAGLFPPDPAPDDADGLPASDLSPGTSPARRKAVPTEGERPLID
jgi:hypothetical protein